jgi:hypothetical protein
MRWCGRQWQRVPDCSKHRLYAFLAGGLVASIFWRLVGYG